MHNITHIQHQFGHYLLNFIKGRVSSVDDAQDIYQEVIYKILSKSDQLHKTQSLKSWLFTITKNQIVDFYRSRKKMVAMDALTISTLELQQETNAYEALEGCLYGFIDQLPEEYKNLIILSEIEGKSQKQLSEMLGMNYTTLRSKIQRGRGKIKQLIFDACVVEQDPSGRFVDCIPRATPVSCGTSNNDTDCCE